MNKKTWRFVSLYSKLAVSISLCLGLAFFGVFLLTQRRLKEDQETFAVEKTMIGVKGAADRVELILSQLENQVDSVYTNPYLYRPLTSEVLDQYSANSLSLILRTHMYTTAGMMVDQIRVNHLGSETELRIRRHDMDLNGEGGVSADKHIGIRGNSYGYGPYIATGYGEDSEEAIPTVFSLQKNIYETDSQRKVASITFDIDVDLLRKAIFSDPEEYGFLSYISGRHDVIITGRNVSFLTEDSSPVTVSSVKDLCGSEGWSKLTVGGTEGFIFGTEFSINGQRFYYARFIADNIVFRQSEERQKENLWIMMLGCAVCTFVALILAHIITDPIRQVDRALNQMTNRQALSYRIRNSVHYSGRDEVSRLIVHTDNLLDVIERQFYRQSVLQEKQKRAEAKMLQAQINPHFLYNALQSIAFLALKNEEVEVFEYITMLGSMMHYCMDLTSEASLREEFDYVQGYLSLQNIRFGGTVDIQARLGSEAEDIVVPKMVLQPLVENAYKHGEIFRRSDSCIRICAEVEKLSTDRVLLIQVEDNGVGCDQERIRELNEMIRGNAEELQENNAHVGICNVYQRLRLFFGDPVEMAVSAGEKGGFAVLIRVRL